MRLSSDRVPTAMWGLAGLLGLMVTMGLFDVAFAGKGVRRNREVFRRIQSVVAAEDGTVALSAYDGVRPECFLPPPPPAPEAGEPTTRWVPPATTEEAPRLPVYVLRGTLAHSDASRSVAFIEVPGLERQKAYRVGEVVHGAEVVAIRSDEVDMRRGESIIRLSIDFKDPAGYAHRSAPTSGGERPERASRGEQEREGASRRSEAMRRARTERSSSPDEFLRRLPRVMREALETMPEGERRRLLELPPTERSRALRELYREYRLQQKRQSRPGESPGRRSGEPRERRADRRARSRVATNSQEGVRAETSARP